MYAGKWRKFEPRPVNGRIHVGAPAYPVEANRAWRFHALVEELMGRREIPETEAADEAYDMPWHVMHACPEADKEPTQ
jgi:hypothetical protein